jgi:DNA-binding YbaB/EbfC family protein
MEVNALQQMLSRLRQVQEDLQQQVNSVAVEASAGGGMVAVKMNGQKQILEVRIEPEIFASKDQEMLQDLIRAAVNEASRRVDDELATQMKSLTGSIPGIAASTSETWLLGSPPNSVEAPENSLDLEVTWACTSMPMTTSQSPVAPFRNFLELG